MRALTPDPYSLYGQVSSLISLTRPRAFHLQPQERPKHRFFRQNNVFDAFQASPSPSGLAAVSCRIEFVSYGPPVRLRLLPTPPRNDAVIFGYEVLAYLDMDFHHAV